MEDSLFDSREYLRSRNAYTAQCAFEYFTAILVTDAFLAKLLKEIGMSDAAVGVVASFISLSFLFQLFSIPLLARICSVKRTVLVSDTLSQLLFFAVYLVPFLPLTGRGKAAAAVICMLGGFAAKYLVSSLIFRWANSYVDPKKRGEYSAVKEMISLLSGIVFTLTVGFVFDRFENGGNLRGGFLLLAGLILFLNACNFVCLWLIRPEDEKEREPRHKLREVLRRTVGVPDFRHVVVMVCLWEAARYASVGFLGTYKTVDLALSVGAVQLINTGANLCRFAVSKPFGRYSDRTSYARGFRLALGIAAAAFAVNIFTAPRTWWLIILYSVLYNVSLAGSNQNSFNIVYSYTDREVFSEAMAIKASVGGLVGFAASLAGSWILAAVQANGNRIFGLPIRGQQVLACLSLILTVAAILYTRIVVERQTVRRQ